MMPEDQREGEKDKHDKDAGYQMFNGGWRMEDGRLRIEDWEWGMEDCR
jgi:hypothetical protein